MKTTEQSDSVITVNNNFEKLNVENSLSNNDRHSSLSVTCDVTPPTNNQSETSIATDDTASNSPEEIVPLQLSDETEDEFQEKVVLRRGNSVDYLKEKAIILLQEELQTARKVEADCIL